jgi:hypothetical protein
MPSLRGCFSYCTWTFCSGHPELGGPPPRPAPRLSFFSQSAFPHRNLYAASSILSESLAAAVITPGFQPPILFARYYRTSSTCLHYRTSQVLICFKAVDVILSKCSARSSLAGAAPAPFGSEFVMHNMAAGRALACTRPSAMQLSFQPPRIMRKLQTVKFCR